MDGIAVGVSTIAFTENITQHAEVAAFTYQLAGEISAAALMTAGIISVVNIFRR